MGAGRKGPVIAVEILDHLGAVKRQPTDTAGENDHRCQKRSKRRLHVRAAGARGQVAARPPISSTVYRHPEVKRRSTKLAWSSRWQRVEPPSCRPAHCAAANDCGEIYFSSGCFTSLAAILATAARQSSGRSASSTIYKMCESGEDGLTSSITAPDCTQNFRR